MPNQPKTPCFTFRLPPELRAAAEAEAEARQVHISDVIVWALQARYTTVGRQLRKPPMRRRRRPQDPGGTEELPIASNS